MRKTPMTHHLLSLHPHSTIQPTRNVIVKVNQICNCFFIFFICIIIFVRNVFFKCFHDVFNFLNQFASGPMNGRNCRVDASKFVVTFQCFFN